MYYVKIQDGKIINKGYKTVEALSPDEGTDIVTEDIYNQLTRMPADFIKDADGNITSVAPAPEPEPVPQPPSTEDRLRAVEDALLAML